MGKEFENELKRAYEDFSTTVSKTALEGYKGILASHINEIERYAENCQFSELAQHMRELGDEAKNVDEITDNMKKMKILTDEKAEEIGDKLTTVWEKLDRFAASELVNNCSCKIRGINY